MAAWSLVLILGLGAFAVALVAMMPVRFAADLVGVQVPGLSGTLWDGQAQLDAGHVAIWDVAARDSMLRWALVFDVQVTGPQTRLTGRVAVRPTQIVIGPLAGQAAWPLLAAVLPGLQIACDSVADVHIGRVILTHDARSGVGQVIVNEGFCDRVDGTVTRVPVPALVADITTAEDGIQAVVTSDDVPLVTARITNADRAQITIHAAGAAMVPGMPSSADSQIDVPLALIR
jgi:hypothetical protein